MNSSLQPLISIKKNSLTFNFTTHLTNIKLPKIKFLLQILNTSCLRHAELLNVNKILFFFLLYTAGSNLLKNDGASDSTSARPETPEIGHSLLKLTAKDFPHKHVCYVTSSILLQG